MKYLITLTLLIFLGTALQAQTYLGAYGGLNRAKLSGTTTELGSFEFELGYATGLRFETNISTDLGLKLIINPSIYTYNSKFVYADSTSEDELDSMRIQSLFFGGPIGFKITTPKERFYVLAACEIGVPVSFKGEHSTGTIDLMDEINPIYINAVFGAGVVFNINTVRLFVETTYSQGITNIANPNSETSTYLPRVRIKSLKILTGIEIPISL